VRITVTAKGPTFQALIRDTVKDLRTGTRTVGPAVAKAAEGTADHPSFDGRRLGVKAKVQAGAGQTTVTVSPAPGDAGGWSILESGARPHPIASPRAMPLGGGRFARTVRHPGASGTGRWTKAAKRTEPKIVKAVETTIDKAMV
jgi:hypothetical protein